MTAAAEGLEERVRRALASLAMASDVLLPDYEEQSANQALRHIDDARRILRGESVEVVETRRVRR